MCALLMLASQPAAADTCEAEQTDPCAGAHCSRLELLSRQQQLTELADQRQCDSELIFPEDGITAVPICLDDEASAVAPLPVFAVEDSRIELPRCRSKVYLGQQLQRYTPDSDDRESDQRSDNPDQALLAPATRQAAVSTLLKLDRRPRPRTDLSGHCLRIYRPPRAR